MVRRLKLLIGPMTKSDTEDARCTVPSRTSCYNVGIAILVMRHRIAGVLELHDQTVRADWRTPPEENLPNGPTRKPAYMRRALDSGIVELDGEAVAVQREVVAAAFQ